MRGRLIADDPPRYWNSVEVVIRAAQDSKFCSWGPRSALVSEDEAWSCPFLGPGRYDVIAGTSLGGEFSPRDLAADLRTGIEVHQGEIVDEIDLRLAAGGSIRGRIIGPDGTALSTPSLHLLDDSGRLLRAEYLSLDDQQYAISSLPPGTVWLVCWTFIEEYVTPAPVRIEVRAGETTDQELHLVSGSSFQMRPMSGNWPRDLRLYVRDSAGCPYPVAPVWDALSGHPMTEGSLPTELSAGPLPPGTYTIELASPGKEHQTRVVTVPGDTEVLLDLEGFG